MHTGLSKMILFLAVLGFSNRETETAKAPSRTSEREKQVEEKMNTKVLVGALCGALCQFVSASETTLYPHVPLVLWSQHS